jgi:hypothetical protein
MICFDSIQMIRQKQKQTLHTQFLKFSLPPFLWLLKCSKKNLRK